MATRARAAPGASLWSELPPEIIGAVLCRIPSAVDRVSFRSVCRSWLAAARCYPPTVPPLPLILCPGFALASPSFTDGDALVTAAHRLPLLGTPLERDPYFGDCVGSFQDWLVCTRLYWRTPPCPWTGADGECFLVNPFSSETIHLPRPCAAHSCGKIQSSVPLCNGEGEVICTIHAPEYAMALVKVVLSAPPGTGPSSCTDKNLGSTCIAAAISRRNGEYKLAFCRPEMQSWCICEGNCIKSCVDIEFYQGKLYIVDISSGDLFAFEFEAPTDRSFPVVSRAEHCLIEKLPLMDGSDRRKYNIVQSHGKLLLVARYFTGSWDQFTGVRVYELDFSSDPWRWVEMKGLGGDSILISSSCSNSFPASRTRYHQIDHDRIYFLDPFCPNFSHQVPGNYSYRSQVYSIRDGRIYPFLIDTGPMKGVPGHPVWFCPSQ
ncbi:uncharacterized protein [Lolium perenne]|uniref:uncharacterized protein n=1 Tax=Lolium perenne TaxID=4522 RepID=UPI0021EAEF7F|nr:uncharacterized protein LOC127295236 [Lolium perenne]